MITEDKVIELFCMADDFCKFFDRMVAQYTFKSAVKRSYHRNSTMSKAEIMLITVYSCFPTTIVQNFVLIFGESFCIFFAFAFAFAKKELPYVLAAVEKGNIIIIYSNIKYNNNNNIYPVSPHP